MKSYIDFLKEIYKERKDRNPGYSLVSFSRDAGFRSYHVHDVFTGRYGISPKRALNVAEKLKMTTEQSEIFVLMVTAENARNKLDRELAQKKLATMSVVQEAELSDEVFSAISEWHNLALLGLISNPHCQQDIEYLAKKLLLPEEIVNQTLTELFKLGLIGRNLEERFYVKNEFFKIHARNLPTQSIQSYHSGIIKKALVSITEFSPDHRNLKSMTVFLDPQSYKEFNSQLNEFTERLLQQFAKREITKESILYVLSHQTFPLENVES